MAKLWSLLNYCELFMKCVFCGLGKSGRGEGAGARDWWVKPGDRELGDTDGNSPEISPTLLHVNLDLHVRMASHLFQN